MADVVPRALLGALRLGSAALPIGAFAYSQGLEAAVAAGAVFDRESAARWVTGLLEASVLPGDLPLLTRLHSAWALGTSADVRRWNDLLFAMRSTRELRDEERQLGGALFRLLQRLGEDRAAEWVRDRRATLGAAFALAGTFWEIPSEQLALAYGFAWAEGQVGAATRLVPLGQSDAQIVLSRALEALERGLPGALARADGEIFSNAPGQALLSAAHETQYSRLFRS